MGTCASRQRQPALTDDDWPSLVLAGASIAIENEENKDITDLCCRRRMMQFETAGHSGILYYKLYCLTCGSTRPDTKRASAQRGQLHSRNAASTLPVQPPAPQTLDISGGKESDTKRPPPLAVD